MKCLLPLMHQSLPHRPVRKRRSGVLSMELILTLPILGMVLLALLEFSLLFSARNQLVEASRVGARLASVAGASHDGVEAEVRRVLSPTLQTGLVVETELPAHSGEMVVVALSVPMNMASPDLLWPAGFTLQGRKLVSETRMVRE